MNKPIPQNGYLKRVRIKTGTAYLGSHLFRIYRPTDAGLHTLVREVILKKGVIGADQILDLDEPIFVRRGDRIAVNPRGLQSSFGEGYFDNVLGLRNFQGFDPLTQVFLDLTVEDTRIYAVGYEMETLNYTDRLRLRDHKIAPETIAVRRSGQSNNEGFASATPNKQPGASLYEQDVAIRRQQNGGTLVLQGYDAPFANTYARINRERHGFTPNIAFLDGANGGTALSNLMRGSATYTKFLGLQEDLAAVEKNMHQLIPIFAQGESDQNGVSTRASYSAKVIEYAQQIAEDNNSKYAVLPLISLQCHTNFIGPFQGIIDIAGGGLDASDHPMVCNIGPAYGHIGIGGMSNGNQAVHYGNRTMQMIGALSAWVAHEYLAGREYAALRVMSARVIGNDIVLQCNKGNVLIDTTIIPAQTAFGIGVYNAAGTKQTISAVTLEAGGRIRIRLTGAPAAQWKVRIGEQIASTTGTTLVPYNGAATNFRGNRPILYSEPTSEFTADPVYDWLSVDEIIL
jgi:hypothetical protein